MIRLLGTLCYYHQVTQDIRRIENQRIACFLDAVVEKYMKSVSTATFHNSKEEVENQCKKNKYISNEENSVQQNAYFLLKSQDANDKNIFLCAAPKVTSRQTIDYMQKIFNVKCGAGSLEGCQVGFDDQGESNTTVSAVLVRHPFDRLIMEFRHQRMTLTGPARVQSRKILFARYRNGNKWKKKGKKSSNEFRQFIKSSVLTPNSTILPISQVIKPEHNLKGFILTHLDLQCVLQRL